MREFAAKQHCETFHLVERQHLEDICRMSASEKWQRMTLVSQLAEKRLRADIVKRHLGISAHEVRMRIASHRIPADLMRKVYGWDPELTDDHYDKEHEVEEQLRQAHFKTVEQHRRTQDELARAANHRQESAALTGDF